MNKFRINDDVNFENIEDKILDLVNDVYYLYFTNRISDESYEKIVNLMVESKDIIQNEIEEKQYGKRYNHVN